MAYSIGEQAFSVPAPHQLPITLINPVLVRAETKFNALAYTLRVDGQREVEIRHDMCRGIFVFPKYNSEGTGTAQGVMPTHCNLIHLRHAVVDGILKPLRSSCRGAPLYRRCHSCNGRMAGLTPWGGIASIILRW